MTGKPMAGVRVRTDAFKRDYYSHRRRLIGGFYAYEHGYDTTRVGRPVQRRDRTRRAC